MKKLLSFLLMTSLYAIEPSSVPEHKNYNLNLDCYAPEEELHQYYGKYKPLQNLPVFLPWLANEEFQACLPETYTCQSIDMQYIVYSFAKQACNIKGDLIEFGTFCGGSANLIAKVMSLHAKNKQFFTVDSFEGLPVLSPEDVNALDGKPYHIEGTLAASYEEVCELLKPFAFVSVVKGFIPDVLNSLPKNRKFAFCHIDLDLYRGTQYALEYIYDKMENGGIILFDDYAHCYTHGEKKAADEFFENKPEKVISLPTNQGFVMIHH